ncbi:MAG TPA: acyl-CoA dehydrogenase [Steroidobacter sp.]|nr:acyl-CoA dehydrogenase [Steroidobacteraceae bacterium]HLS82239.1 acyl-CoA dehydrogenase [Steroidobacter sp.]
MSVAIWIAVLLAGALVLAYQRVSLLTATLTFGVGLLVYAFIGNASLAWLIVLWAVLAGLVLLNIDAFRIRFITRPFLRTYRRMLPSMSQTEKDALEAGTVWWDGELFTGDPDWEKLLGAAPPRLSNEEQAFLDGPCEELCRMVDDWDVTHRRADLPPHVWGYLKSKGFFAMIIPKKYGGLEFSTYAHSCVLAKLASRSGLLGSTVAVPNSLGPAELLLHYGAQEQRDYYLPRLARGDEVPCFALTGPRAGSDAASIPDTGVVCRGTYEGREVLGLRLNFSKRYITLAPVATVIGLAFRLYDPDRLLGDERTDYGVTCALVPCNTPGVTIGRRHFPLNVPFQNGPIQGKDVFVPLDFIIGGPKMAGQGWRMLVEQLSVGRCISLPSNATGACKAAVFASGAYARIRRQFNVPIGNFEGVADVLARMAGLTYIMDAARSVTAGAIDGGEKPSVPSAMLKYHLTEYGRIVANDAMDVHGGKGICLGPKNYLGRGYQLVPVGITVEGANLLTRSLMIFGQGAIRCHPFVLREMNAARDKDKRRGLKDFDAALFGHIGFTISNAARSLVMALTLARFSRVPEGPTQRFYQHINRFSASFAFATDVAMLTLGGYLKKKESLSGRLGDVLSCMYLASMVLKHYENQGRPEEDLPLVEWACRSLLYKAQEQLHGFLRNFPNRFLAGFMRFFIFPRGRTYYAPADPLAHEVAEQILRPTATRDRLTHGVYRTVEPSNPLGQLAEAMALADSAEPLQKRVRVEGVKTGRVTALDLPGQIQQALAAGVLTESEAAMLLDYDRRVMDIVHVDDFAPEELAAGRQPEEEPRAARVSNA